MTQDEILKMYVEEDRPFLHFADRYGNVVRSVRKLFLYVADSSAAIAVFNYESGSGWVEAAATGEPTSGRRIPEGFDQAIEAWGGRP